MRRDKPRRIGEILMEHFGVTPAQVALALAEQRREPSRRLGEILVASRATSEEAVARALALQLRLPFYDLSTTEILESVAKRLPEHVAGRLRVLAIGSEKDALVVCMADPLDVLAVDEIASMTGTRIKPAVAAPGDLQAAMEKIYGLRWNSSLFGAPDDTDPALVLRALPAASIEGDGPLMRLSNLILACALSEQTPEVRIEPDERGFHVMRCEKAEPPSRVMRLNRVVFGALLGLFAHRLGLRSVAAGTAASGEFIIGWKTTRYVVRGAFWRVQRGEALRLRFERLEMN
ncbi:MAG: hypothetical protein HY303_09325 [Candidatus Wallbacteria bacterium]|nr:hypothetical protein [Candidatus Wallbacteria bacterium]